MTPFLCAAAAWVLGNLATALVIHRVARTRVGVPRKLVWGGLALSVVVLVIWMVTFMVVLIVADQQGTRATNGELVTSCGLWSAIPMLLTFALHVLGLVRATRAPRPLDGQADQRPPTSRAPRAV